jgi:hypothetical protein
VGAILLWRGSACTRAMNTIFEMPHLLVNYLVRAATDAMPERRSVLFEVNWQLLRFCKMLGFPLVNDYLAPLVVPQAQSSAGKEGRTCFHSFSCKGTEHYTSVVDLDNLPTEDEDEPVQAPLAAQTNDLGAFFLNLVSAFTLCLKKVRSELLITIAVSVCSCWLIIPRISLAV